MQMCMCCTDWSQFKIKISKTRKVYKVQLSPVSIYTMQFTKLHECDPLILLCGFFIMWIRVFIWIPLFSFIYIYFYLFIYSPPWLDSPSGPRPPYCWGFEITFRYITICRTSLDEWSACHRDLQLTTRNTHKREGEIHVPSDIWTLKPSKQVAADSRLRPHSIQDQHMQLHSYNNKIISEQTTGESNPLFKIACDFQLQHTNTTEYVGGLKSSWPRP